MIVKPDLSSPLTRCPRFPGKVLYETERAAHRAAARHRSDTGDDRIRAYRCRGHFHLGKGKQGSHVGGGIA